MTPLLLDTGILGQLCHPNRDVNRAVGQWLTNLLVQRAEDFEVGLPEICDYELRRKLLHLLRTGKTTKRSLDRLDQLAADLEYLPIKTSVLRAAAELWAEARATGLSTAPMEALDGDVILAAQAREIAGVVVTSNRKHLARFVSVMDWTEISPGPGP